MSIDLITELRSNRKTAHVAYTEFTVAYSKNANMIYCFFEGGEDKRYYGTRIKIKYNLDYEDFDCGGKDNVKKVVKLVEQHYKDAHTLFFMDKDFSNDVTNNEIYVTPCYSIENFYTNHQVLEEILINEFDMKKTDDDFHLSLELFNNLQNKFHAELLVFNSWLACQYDIKIEQDIKTFLSIDENVKRYFIDIVKANLQEISNFDDLKDINVIQNTLFPEAPKIDMEILEKKIEKFKESNSLGCQYRGKFELKFFVAFLRKLTDELNKKNSTVFKKKRKCKLQFKVENIISVITQHAITAECLYKFFDEHLKSA
ncbi:DUF4435 domain-containing protein [Arcobacter sp. F2176]|uniref:DUF4435 domain-containing protein n=1 Tax=Arcobacter sp. F2176 TaxID=2044511 RepID=UPI00100AEA82|nr:DUF4435 domain-containing protein [Arcobacter sp. F2176]RXJ79450.1 hypothetical protein CRU95_13995 [Arcobacter sp. F2176]